MRQDVRQALGDAFLAGPWNEDGLLERAHLVVRVEPGAAWLARIVRRTLRAYRYPPYDAHREFHAWLDLQLRRVPSDELPRVVGRLTPILAMGPARWPVPPLVRVGDLAARFDLDLADLEWLADVRGLERLVPAEKLRNYSYRWIPRDGGLPRLLEMPKRFLKGVQRRVLHELVDLIPPHPDAHGFRPGHSAVSNARRHIGSEVLIGFDLEDFFASVTGGRVYGIFRGAGYPEDVAHKLTALCTNVVPRIVWEALPEHARSYRLRRRLAEPHLPQGSPTSPALANLAAFGLDRRLAALALETGASYSRYADDLSFSGGKELLARGAPFRRLVEEIVEDEGFRLNRRKSRLTTQAGRQVVTGVVVNAHPNMPRAEYDRLRAVLRDAARNGPERANRAGVPDFRSHLLGRIAWAESLNPARGAKLRAAFADIHW
jgi:hypothetical protein